MNIIDEASLDGFLSRFFNFYDGVVQQVSLDFRAEPLTCDVVMHAQDTESPSGWSEVVLRINDMTECRLEIGRTSFQVLSSGLQVGWVGGSVLLFLDAYPDEDGLPPIDTNSAYVGGREMQWSAIPLE